MAASISPPPPIAAQSQPRRSRLLDALDGNFDSPAEDTSPSPIPPSLSQLGIGKRKREQSSDGNATAGLSQKRVASGSSVHDSGAGHSKEELNKLPTGLLAYTQSTGVSCVLFSTLSVWCLTENGVAFFAAETSIRPSQLENQVAGSLQMTGSTPLPRRADAGGFHLNYDRESPLNPRLDVGGPDQAQRYVPFYSFMETHSRVWLDERTDNNSRQYSGYGGLAERLCIQLTHSMVVGHG